MTLRTPPSWLQNGSHPAENDRLSVQALYATTGIIGSSSLAVTANSPAGMSVRVASGWAAIVGTTQSNMGVYTIYNDAQDTLTITTADPTLNRIDRVVVTVRDAYYTGAFNDVIFQVIAGTPGASPSAPATPANSISLATVAVNAAVTQINTGNITDTRVEVTTNLSVGDITGVTAGTGLTGGGSSGAVSLAIDSTVATLTGTQTLTNKTLTTPVISSISNTGTLTLPTSTDTLVGRATTDTLTNKTLTTPVITIGQNTPTFTANDYTLVLADQYEIVLASNGATAGTISIPTNATAAFPTGTQITVVQTGSGQLTIQAASSGTTTVNSTGATATAPKLRAQWSSATCIKTATDTWLVVGDIA
jgi:hypothetical protein